MSQLDLTCLFSILGLLAIILWLNWSLPASKE
jgi:hypothetical protein